MKRILQRLANQLGYHILPIDKDPIQKNLIEAYRKLRFVSSDDKDRSLPIAKIAFAEHLRQILHYHKINAVMDIGANTGQFGLLLRNIGYRGLILSFEPLSKVRKKLQSTAMLHEPWRVFPYALGSSKGEKLVQVFGDHTFSSMYNINSKGKKIFGALLRATGEEKALVRTLDNLASEMGLISNNDGLMVKTDTQGHDLQVLKGGLQTLSKARVVLTEAIAEPIYDQVPRFPEIVEFLEKHGFAPSGFYPISHRPENLAMIEFDAVFVKRSKSTQKKRTVKT